MLLITIVIHLRLLGVIMMKRIVARIPQAIHNDIKRLAKKRNITASRWILRALVAALKQEHSYD
jgi:hypothetical protein